MPGVCGKNGSSTSKVFSHGPDTAEIASDDVVLNRCDKVGFETTIRDWMSGRILKDANSLYIRNSDVNGLIRVTHTKFHIVTAF